MILSSLASALMLVNFSSATTVSRLVPAFEVPVPQSFSSHWMGRFQLWLENGEWYSDSPELRLSTQCRVEIQLSEGDRLLMLRDRRAIRSFRFPGASVSLTPQMVSGELNGGEGFFWNQDQIAQSVLPSVLGEVAFAPRMQRALSQLSSNRLKHTGRLAGLQLMTELREGGSQDRGTKISHLWCRGPLLKLDQIQNVFQSPQSIIITSL